MRDPDPPISCRHRRGKTGPMLAAVPATSGPSMNLGIKKAPLPALRAAVHRRHHGVFRRRPNSS
ncbi:MAG: hypothetical protein EBR28_04245 [Planctomycetia bacterium]|nr:hypothetical protein [Planctomycetia bacterium]